MPPFAIGVFEQFVVARMLERYPKIYQLAQNNEFLNVGTFWGWAINAIYHSIVLFFLVFVSLGADNLTLGNPFMGYSAGQWYMGSLLYTAVLATVLLKAALISM
jgi:phospholipid-transporting ATPase